jgi:pimeloyl-ACP methyl ester carboxylesterase
MSQIARILSAVVGLVALILVASVATSWAPDRPVSELTARWAQPPSTFIDVAGLPAHVRDEGPRDDPTPIVLLHGTSDSLHTWGGWTEVLAGERRVIRVDLPGFGLTGPVPDGDYRVERYVDFVGELLDTLGVRRFVVVGNSFGGWVAWETALAHPDRVAALVLVDSAGYPLESQSVPIGFRVARVPGLNRLLRSILPRGLVDSSVRNTYGDPTRVTEELVDRYYELTLRDGNRAALAQRFADGRWAEDPGRIRQLQLPTLVLWGGRDRLIPLHYGERFHRDIAGSELVVFPELGHVPQEEDPRATVAAVRRFLSRLAPGPAVATSTPGPAT